MPGDRVALEVRSEGFARSGLGLEREDMPLRPRRTRELNGQKADVRAGVDGRAARGREARKQLDEEPVAAFLQLTDVVELPRVVAGEADAGDRRRPGRGQPADGSRGAVDGRAALENRQDPAGDAT